MVGINKDHFITIDLTSHQLVVRTLTEVRITCGAEDKVCVCVCVCALVGTRVHVLIQSFQGF